MRLLVASALLLLASPALAQAPEPAPVRLEYTGPAICADAATFRNLVASRMRGGRDPFTTDASRRLVVVLNRQGPGFTADAAMYNAAGVRRYHRQLDAPDCTELAESTALVVSLWLTPVVLPAAPPSPAPPSKPPEPEKPVEQPKPPATKDPEPESKKAELPAEPVRVPIVPRVDVDVRVDFGLAPQPLVGVKVGAGFRRGWFLLQGELRWDPLASTILTSGVAVRTGLISGGLAGCARRQWRVAFVGCVVGEVGQIQRSFGTDRIGTYQQAGVYAAGGASVNVEVSLPSWLYVHAGADLRGARTLASDLSNRNSGMTVNGGSAGRLVGGIDAGLGVSF
jgi:hypothetical protein